MSRKLKAQFVEIEKSSKLLKVQNHELKKLNGELDRFIYSAAHDLKSPLASLSGLIHLVKLEINTPEHGHYFERMDQSIAKLESFIKDITDYAKNKRQQVRVEAINLEKIFESVLFDLQYLPQAKFIQPFLRVSAINFQTDRTRLEIVVKNILSNAYRYYDKEKKSSYIFIEATLVNDSLTLDVMDNGIGIGDNHLSKIFDMFYRAVDSSHGTGIGLFLVRESVKMLRGKISVKSSLGEWTRFTIIIPNLKDNQAEVPEHELVILETEA
jgi:signal transduction histidine kinase